MRYLILLLILLLPSNVFAEQLTPGDHQIAGDLIVGGDSDITGNESVGGTLEIGGESLFKDKVKFTQTDGNEAIDSLADGYMDYLATTAHRFNANVNITGMMRQSNIWHAYGGYEDKAYTLVCDDNVWTQITNGTNDLWGGTETDGITLTGDQITFTNAGDYAGIVSLTISALNGKDFHLQVYNITQASTEGFSLGISATGAGNKMNITLPIYIEAAASDVVEMRMKSTDGTDPILDDGLFYINYLHD